MDEVRLYFSSGRVIRLFRIESIFGGTRHVATILGAGIGEEGIGGFRWTRGVKVVSILLVRLALATLDSSVAPRIEGGHKSMAAALDGALSQEPLWLVEMFGLVNNKPRYRHIFVRSNPGRKRYGPVAVSLSQRLRGENIRIFLNNSPVLGTPALERILLQLMEQAH